MSENRPNAIPLTENEIDTTEKLIRSHWYKGETALDNETGLMTGVFISAVLWLISPKVIQT